MRYEEDDLLPLSALQHLLFCERQCALIHIEQVWVENQYTAEGRIMHDRVHSEDHESRRDVRVEFGVPLRSLRLGLIGKADVVEFTRCRNSRWRPFPIEYKRGKPKPDHCDSVQLCAQALCLEEMLEADIPAGALFYGRTRRRLDVCFDAELRMETEEAAQRLHALIRSGRTPKPEYLPRCKRCSLQEVCLPKTIGKARSANRYLSSMLEAL